MFELICLELGTSHEHFDVGTWPQSILDLDASITNAAGQPAKGSKDDKSNIRNLKKYIGKGLTDAAKSFVISLVGRRCGLLKYVSWKTQMTW